MFDNDNPKWLIIILLLLISNKIRVWPLFNGRFASMIYLWSYVKCTMCITLYYIPLLNNWNEVNSPDQLHHFIIKYQSVQDLNLLSYPKVYQKPNIQCEEMFLSMTLWTRPIAFMLDPTLYVTNHDCSESLSAEERKRNKKAFCIMFRFAFIAKRFFLYTVCCLTSHVYVNGHCTQKT